MTEPVRRLVEHIRGDGWLTQAGEGLGQVSYVIDVWQVERSRGRAVERSRGPAKDGLEINAHLTHHTVNDVPANDTEPLTLHLADGRSIAGFLSPDGSRFVRTGPLIHS